MEQLILRLSDVIELDRTFPQFYFEARSLRSIPCSNRLGPLGTTSKGWRTSDVVAWLADLN